MCTDCQGNRDQRMVALVGADPDRSTVRKNGNMDPENAYRTGDILWMSEELFAKVFDVPVPEQGLCFVEPEVVRMINESREAQANGCNS